MFRNQYDSDIATWSPQGRIHQIEYAMEAVKQGSATLALRSDTHAVLAAIKRSGSDLGSYQKKIFKVHRSLNQQVDDHIGLAISGLTADGRVLLKYMRTEAMNHKYVYDTDLQTHRLVLKVADSTPPS